MRAIKPALTEETIKYLERVTLSKGVILEYGVGGSTLLFAEAGNKVVSVETDAKWLVKVIEEVTKEGYEGVVYPLWANIGPTKEWGHPVDDKQRSSWPDFSKGPWKFIKNSGLHPDYVLIDGRFRVSCLIASALFCERPVTVLFDDYAQREYYHIVEKHFKPVDIVDNRMAVFDIAPDQVPPGILDEFSKSFYDPR